MPSEDIEIPPDAPPRRVAPRPTASDPAVQRLIADAAARAHFFRGPHDWLDTHTHHGAPLLAAYARALARELGGPSQEPSCPTWLDPALRDPALPSPAPADTLPEVRMGAAVIAAATLAAVLVVATVASAVTSLASASPPPPVPKPKPL